MASAQQPGTSPRIACARLSVRRCLGPGAAVVGSPQSLAGYGFIIGIRTIPLGTRWIPEPANREQLAITRLEPLRHRPEMGGLPCDWTSSFALPNKSPTDLIDSGKIDRDPLLHLLAMERYQDRLRDKLILLDAVGIDLVHVGAAGKSCSRRIHNADAKDHQGEQHDPSTFVSTRTPFWVEVR